MGVTRQKDWPRLCWLIGSLAGVMALATGCVQRRVNIDRGPREYVATDYRTVLKRWTRSEAPIVAGAVNDLLLATATYESWDFRWAYTIRYAEDFRLTVAERQQLLETQLGETAEVHQFFVAVHAPQSKWADLTRDPPAWVVRLIDETGNETAPLEIKVLRRPTPLDLSYFPYLTPWRTGHRIRFPVVTDGHRTIAPNARWFGLRFSGPSGYQQLVWEVRASPEAG